MTKSRGLQGVKVGDTLVRSGHNVRRDEEVTVTRVGRKLLYVEMYGREFPFRIETGVANDNYGHDWLRTPAQVAESRRRTLALVELRGLGFQPVGFSTAGDVATETLERVVSVLREAASSREDAVASA